MSEKWKTDTKAQPASREALDALALILGRGGEPGKGGTAADRFVASVRGAEPAPDPAAEQSARLATGMATMSLSNAAHVASAQRARRAAERRKIARFFRKDGGAS